MWAWTDGRCISGSRTDAAAPAPASSPQQKLLCGVELPPSMRSAGRDTERNYTASKKIITFIITGLKHLANNRSNYKHVASASLLKSSLFLLAWRTVHQSHSICYQFQNKRIVSLVIFN